MQKRIPLLAAATLAIGAAIPTTNLLAQQAGFPSVFVDGVHYIPETAQASVVQAPVIIAGGGYVAANAAPRAYQPQRDIDELKGHIGFGPGLYILKPKDGKSMNHNGSSFWVGWSAFPSEIGRVRFNFDIGVYYWNEKETYENYRYKDDSFAVPLMFTASYEFNLGSPKFRARAGLVLGETLLVSSYDYPGDSDAAAAAITNYGSEIGFSWTPNKSFHLDLGYRILANSTAKFKFDNWTGEMKSSAQQWTLSIGWRF